MKETLTAILRQIITDFQAATLPTPSEREVCMPVIPKGVRKSVTLVGMRRSGKTWTVYQHIRELLTQGLDRRKILYLNFDDDRLRPFVAADCQAIMDAFFSLAPDLAERTDVHFFFDEIQEIDGWELFIRRLLDQERMSLVLTGSSSRMLSREIATALRGRTLTREIFPFSFREYLHAKNVPFEDQLTSKQLAAVRHHREVYQTFGGFPEAVILDRAMHRELLQGYIDTVIFRDIIERHRIGASPIVREFVSYCLQNSGTLISLHRIYQRFRSMGRTLSKDLLYSLLAHLEDAYCLFAIPLFSHSAHDRTRHPRKIYAADPGLVTAYSVKPAFDRAARLETMIFNELRRKTNEIFYVKTASGREVDFLALHSDGRRELLQVCVTMAEQETSEREVSALIEAMQEQKIGRAAIVTEDDAEGSIKSEGKRIDILPSWKWLIGGWYRKRQRLRRTAEAENKGTAFDQTVHRARRTEKNGRS